MVGCDSEFKLFKMLSVLCCKYPYAVKGIPNILSSSSVQLMVSLS
jgi:hypothetical protein